MSFRVHLNPTVLGKHRNNCAHWRAGEKNLRTTQRNHVPGPRVAILDLSPFQLFKRDLSEVHELLLDSLALSSQTKWWFIRSLWTGGASSWEKQWVLKRLPEHFVSSILFVGWFHPQDKWNSFHWSEVSRGEVQTSLNTERTQSQEAWPLPCHVCSMSGLLTPQSEAGFLMQISPYRPRPWVECRTGAKWLELGRERDPSCYKDCKNWLAHMHLWKTV